MNSFRSKAQTSNYYKALNQEMREKLCFIGLDKVWWRSTVRIAGGRPGSQWPRSDGRRAQACWRRTDRSRRTPFLLVGCPRSSPRPPSPSLSLSLSLSICSSILLSKYMKWFWSLKPNSIGPRHCPIILMLSADSTLLITL
jgi:hypothetical protein